MKKSILIRLTFLLLAFSTITGCLWIPVEEGGRGNHHGGSYGGGHGGERHENNDRR